MVGVVRMKQQIVYRMIFPLDPANTNAPLGANA